MNLQWIDSMVFEFQNVVVIVVQYQVPGTRYLVPVEGKQYRFAHLGCKNVRAHTTSVLFSHQIILVCQRGPFLVIKTI